MAITAAGVGSGLDIENIVSQLMNLERRPLNALSDRESQYKTELSAYGRLKSGVSAFQDAMAELSSTDKFRVFSPQSSNDDVLTATADSAAASGSYSLQVDRLAQNHKLGSDEVADTATFGGTAGDSIDLTVGSDTLSVDLSTAKTLSEIRDAINGDASNPGVTATILNTGSGVQRLILTADESGYDQRVQLSYGGSIAAGTLNLTDNNKDGSGTPLGSLTELDAAYSVDGYSLTSSSNRVAGVIDGITLELNQTGSANLTLSRDTDKIKESAQAFVDAYNSLQGSLKKLSGGDLKGDSALRSIQNQLRDVINTPPSGLGGNYNSLFSVGISTNAKTGELEFDTSAFETALDSDFNGVSDLFANDDQGFAFRFDALAGSILDTNGLIDTREEGLNSRIKRVQSDKLDMQGQLDLREKALRSQYAALDSLVGRLNSTSQFLFQQLGSGR